MLQPKSPVSAQEVCGEPKEFTVASLNSAAALALRGSESAANRPSATMPVARPSRDCLTMIKDFLGEGTGRFGHVLIGRGLAGDAR